MKYITGIHALNIEDSTDCCGDWHTSGIQWGSPHFNDTDASLFGTLKVLQKRQGILIAKP